MMNQHAIKILDDYTLRPMALGDVFNVFLLESEVHPFPWSEKIFADCVRVGYDAWVLTDRYNLLVGYSITSHAANESHLLNITTKPRIRGQGLGRRMMENIVKQSQHFQSIQLLLEVRCSNDVAIRLYQSLGFELLSKRPDYYPANNGREDALVFALSLK